MNEAVMTDRLRLLPADVADLQACIDGNRAAFRAATGAEAPDPFVAPPLTDDVMDSFRDAVAADPDLRPWFFRWVIERERGTLVGSAGFGGRPNDDGLVYLGYSIYAADAGRRYASEAARALGDWALVQPGVAAVQATIKPDNPASLRVAAKAGMRKVGELKTDEDGLVEVWERRRTIAEF